MSVNSVFWELFIENELKQDYMINLFNFLRAQESSGRIIYPSKSNLFKAFYETPLEKTKVVIIGQDPYHGENQAHGLSFSVQDKVKIPPSLRNIFKEIHDDLGISQALSGNLLPWAKQGVLLLNSVLTVEKGVAGSHRKKGWEHFTDKVIEALNTQERGLVFMLWGAPAQKKAAKVDASKHLVLRAPHPSPLSSYRGFFGCKHFSQANKYLLDNSQTPINWQI